MCDLISQNIIITEHLFLLTTINDPRTTIIEIGPSVRRLEKAIRLLLHSFSFVSSNASSNIACQSYFIKKHTENAQQKIVLAVSKFNKERNFFPSHSLVLEKLLSDIE